MWPVWLWAIQECLNRVQITAEREKNPVHFASLQEISCSEIFITFLQFEWMIFFNSGLSTDEQCFSMCIASTKREIESMHIIKNNLVTCLQIMTYASTKVQIYSITDSNNYMKLLNYLNNVKWRMYVYNTRGECDHEQSFRFFP